MYDPQAKARREIVGYFERHAPSFPGLAALVRAFFDAPSIDAAATMLTAFFDRRPSGEMEPLETIVGCFASKRVVLRMVEQLLGDPHAMERVAASSYPHPIGFDKLVLYHHRDQSPGRGFKLRLHLYWRSPQFLAAERPHVHRFEMASAPITGELSNHRWQIVGWEPAGTHIPGVTVVPPREDAPTEIMEAYSGYQRDPDGSLHKRYLGQVKVQSIPPRTFVPGLVYGQVLEDVHYVETNAETGHTNGDFCSTIYVHGPPLTDDRGRTIPVLLERQRLPHDDTLIESIANVTVADLAESLGRYAGVLRESLAYYEWLYDPKYGRNLSVGMVAGYLLSERLEDPNTIDLWSQRYPTCKRVLAECSAVLAALVRKEQRIDDIPDGDRTRRYYRQLLAKATAHQPGGPEAWLAAYGDLRKEMWRYLGALMGDYSRNPDTRVLKPVWEMTESQLVGGAHYGHVSAMLDAAYQAAELVDVRFRDTSAATRAWLDVAEKAGEGPVSQLDREVQAQIRRILAEHYPDHAFAGEEGEAGDTVDATHRWLVDPLDGTRNFLAGNKHFAISIAAQRRESEGWVTTDAVVSLPMQRELYWAERDQGAFLIDADGDEHRLRVGEPMSAQGALVDLSIRGLGPAAPILRARLAERGAVDRRLGTSAVALAMVSGTGYHAAIQTAAPHDVAAGQLIAREAGAVVLKRSLVRDGRSFTVHLAAQSDSLARMLCEDVDTALRDAKIEHDHSAWAAED